MSDPFVAEIRIVGFNFAPTGWALCSGQLMPISQNTALFSLLGTFYGGDGKSTFALPNLEGSFPMHQGQGPGMSDRFLGEIGGQQNVTLLQTEMPAHAHTPFGTSTAGVTSTPDPSTHPAASAARRYQSAASDTNLSPFAWSIAGNSFPHNNMSPYLVMNFIIALQGVFPARN